MAYGTRMTVLALGLVGVLSACNTAAGVADGIGGVFLGVSDDIRSVGR
jgi:hypothetical protein